MQLTLITLMSANQAHSFLANSRVRNWCFTLNNPRQDELQDIISFAESKDCKYLIIGHEVSKDGSTPHLQGYLEGAKKFRLTGLRTCCRGFSRGHLEKRKGSASQASEYCKKEGNFTEYGSLSRERQGRRTDLEEIQDSIINGSSDLEIANNNFSKWVVYRRSFSQYRRLVRNTPRTWKSVVVVLWGQTGCGKTRFVFDQCGETPPWIHGGDRWFDGYEGHKYALLDDFDGSQLEFRLLLRLLDRYPMQVPIKGRFVNWAPRKIYITSNTDPAGWYNHGCDRSHNALLRRLDIVNHITKDIYSD